MVAERNSPRAICDARAPELAGAGRGGGGNFSVAGRPSQAHSPWVRHRRHRAHDELQRRDEVALVVLGDDAGEALEGHAIGLHAAHGHPREALDQAHLTILGDAVRARARLVGRLLANLPSLLEADGRPLVREQYAD